MLLKTGDTNMSVSVWILVVLFSYAGAVLKITYMDDLCMKNKESSLFLRYQSSGILVALPSMYPRESMDCEVTLVPDLTKSIVLSILRYNVKDEDTLTIEDSDLFKISLIGQGYYFDERKAIVSPGKIKIRYIRGNSTFYSTRPRFQFTFTQVTEGPACSSNEFQCRNGNCVPNEYSCDGHNHCGDRNHKQNCFPEDDTKDERLTTPYDPDTPDIRSNASYMRDTGIAMIIASAVIVFIIVIVFIVVLLYRYRGKPHQTPTPRAPPLQSVLSNVPHQPPSASEEIAPAPSAPERESIYMRIRSSFRNPKKVEVNPPEIEEKKTDTYQVPSMYPNLEMHGTDNTDFKIEE